MNLDEMDLKELCSMFIMPRSFWDDSFFYGLYRRIFSCKRGIHRFMYVDVVDEEFCSLTSGYYYCTDCGMKSTPWKISEYWKKGSDVWGNEFYQNLMMQKVSLKNQFCNTDLEEKAGDA